MAEDSPQSPQVPGASQVPVPPPGVHSPATGRVRLIVLLVVLGVIVLMVAGGIALVGVMLKFASSAIDPAANQQTGLADGSYVIRPNERVVVNDQCSFTGPAYEVRTEQQAAESVTVAGSGPDCIYRATTSLVAVTVRGGTAEITQVR